MSRRLAVTRALESLVSFVHLSTRSYVSFGLNFITNEVGSDESDGIRLKFIMNEVGSDESDCIWCVDELVDDE